MRELEKFFLEQRSKGEDVYATILDDGRAFFWLNNVVGYLRKAEDCMLNPHAFRFMCSDMRIEISDMFNLRENENPHGVDERINCTTGENRYGGYTILESSSGTRHFVNRDVLGIVMKDIGDNDALYTVWSTNSELSRVLFTSNDSEVKYILIPLFPWECEK